MGNEQSNEHPSEKFCREVLLSIFPKEPLGIRDRNLLAVLSVQPVGVMAGRGVACKQGKNEYLPKCCGSGSGIQCFFLPLTKTLILFQKYRKNILTMILTTSGSIRLNLKKQNS
jgi:hypothetical protein